jgi:hypothetical protein
MDRVTQRLWRGVEGPRRCLIYPCRSELFNHRGRRCLSLESRTQRSTPDHSSVYRSRVLLSGVGGRKAQSGMGKSSTAEVLRLRATSAVSLDPSVRRSAQDDGFVGGLEYNWLNMAPSRGNPGDACLQMLLGAFRPQPATQGKKVRNSDRSGVEGRAIFSLLRFLLQ